MPRVLFTRESAREMARRSNAVQAAKRRERASIASVTATATATTTPEPQYAAIRLARVRALLELLDRRLLLQLQEGKPDGRLLRDLAAAAAALSQQECWLSGRPRPGVRKPTRARTLSMADLAEPEPLPMPAPAPQVSSPEPRCGTHDEVKREMREGSPGVGTPALPAPPAPNAPQATAPTEKPAAPRAPPARVPLPLASSPLIQKAGPPARMVRLSDGRLGYEPVVPPPAKRP